MSLLLPLQGLLLVDKPKTWTSFDIVNYVRRMVAAAEAKKPRSIRVGHCGTLDPLATGLLILLVGKEYTRQAARLTKLDKTYHVTMKLGETSTTADGEGNKTVTSVVRPKLQVIKQALATFTGELLQTPPVYSAIKIGGQRSYKLAREGKTVALEARPVTIYDTTFVAYDYPYVQFCSKVSSGTYIRSLVEDLGQELGTGAYMSDLRRTHIGSYELAQACTVTNLDQEKLTLALQTSVHAT